MIAFIVALFVGKSYFSLALKSGKNQWFALLLGIGILCIGILIGHLINIVCYKAFNIAFPPNSNAPPVYVIALPYGILISWVFYGSLKNNWGEKLP